MMSWERGDDSRKRWDWSKGLRWMCMRMSQDCRFGSFISGSRICAGGLRIAAGRVVQTVHEARSATQLFGRFCGFALLVGWIFKGAVALRVLFA